jgi:tRNA pseudouridine55 synthase
MFSALKCDGQPLYARARAGEVVERAARPVNIMTLELVAFASPQATITLRCSKGTYVRSLAHDLGRALGTGAHLTALRRTRSGPFTLAQAIPPDALGVRPLPLVPPAAALAHLPSLVVSDEQARTIAEGRRLAWSEIMPASASLEPHTRVRLLTSAGDLLAVAPVGAPGELVRTVRVFRAAIHTIAPAQVEGNAP